MSIFSLEHALKWAKMWADYLGIKDKKIEVIESNNEFHEVKVLKNDVVIPEQKKRILNDDFDTIRALACC